MNYQYIALGAAGLSVLLLIMWLWLFLRVRKVDSIRQEFYDGAATQKLDDVIASHDQDIKKIFTKIDHMEQFVQGLSTANRNNFQKVGFVRFNPFDDAGGSISFAIALLDAHDNGFVISSLHGREGNRVYAKEVKAGSSKSQLTGEEMEAIKNAQ
jgi:hypothetical protein